MWRIILKSVEFLKGGGNMVHEGKYGLFWEMWCMMGVLVIVGNVIHDGSSGYIE